MRLIALSLQPERERKLAVISAPLAGPGNFGRRRETCFLLAAQALGERPGAEGAG
jgi:hypothetical protein